MKEEKEEKEKKLKGENLLRDIYGQLLLPQQSVYLEQAEQKLEEAVNERVFDSYHCIKLHAKSLEAA